MRKTDEEIMTKAVQCQSDFTDFFIRLLHGFGDLTDQARVMGHMCQAGVDLAQVTLEQLRLQDEQDKPKIVLAN